MFDRTLTAHLAELSKIALTEEELAQMTEDMKQIAALMDQVRGFHAEQEMYTLSAVNYDDLRSDIPLPSLETEQILRNAKKTKHNSFTVPKIV